MYFFRISAYRIVASHKRFFAYLATEGHVMTLHVAGARAEVPAAPARAAAARPARAAPRRHPLRAQTQADGARAAATCRRRDVTHAAL